jgi:DNA-directed RNA polymerase specialized sigma subunit
MPKPQAEAPNRLENQHRDAYLAYRSGPTPATTGGFLKSIEPLVRLGMRTYGGGESPLVYSRARQIALKAMPSYDPTRASLKTHLLSHMRGLQRYTNNLESTLSVPEQVALDHQRVYRAQQELEDELGRAPSDQELSDYAKLSPKRLNYVRSYRPAVAEGQMQSLFHDGVSGEQDLFDPAVERLGASHEHAMFLYHDLDPHDQIILERSLGLNGHRPMSRKDIARHLKLSSSAVTQRAQRIQEQLDRVSGAGLF